MLGGRNERMAPHLIGRDDEVAALFAVLDSGPTGQVVVISGALGSGKTTLLEAACRRAADRGIPVLRIAGSHAETATDYAGLEQLRDVVGDIETVPDPARVGQMLLERIAGQESRTPPRVRTVTPELVVRASSAPANSPSPASSSRNVSISPISGREVRCRLVQDRRMAASGSAALRPASSGSFCCACCCDALGADWESPSRSISSSPGS